ncbi:hypothetical protein MuYL_3954 [Mucilaginibacter xinganensis]|uniref:Uncharacterized protein n=1 Tax=Mucilaginibacter xinganensis TaxID=1234841 RepID=A0A223P117_9SPHI|nr:hypothetical protein MuYL_3954 [Mucilaginibacter xinganensis]
MAFCPRCRNRPRLLARVQVAIRQSRTMPIITKLFDLYITAGLELLN